MVTAMINAALTTLLFVISQLTKTAAKWSHPRLAKRDRSYRPLPTNAALYLLAQVTGHLTLPTTNECRRFRRLFADVGRTVPHSPIELGEERALPAG
ncbi:MAG: hypothetical protein QOI89_3668 [Solirubrobacteraceae bacterium]|nr:hypothetical protein [Solirubrobacteraceae bacterium]